VERLVTFGILLSGLCATAFAADAVLESQQNLLQDIKFLASDELEGRGVGSKGLDQAADFIRNEFAKAGLNVASVKNGAFQTFDMTTGATLGKPNTLALHGPEGKQVDAKLNADFTPLSFGGSGTFAGELVFCGYGIEAPDKNYDDFAGLDLKGKIALIMRREPQQGNPHGAFAGTHGELSLHSELRTKVSNAFGKGAAAVIFVDDPHAARESVEQLKKQISKQAEIVAAAAEEFDGVSTEQGAELAEARKKLGATVSRMKELKTQLAAGEPDRLMKFGYGGNESARSIPLLQISRKLCDEILHSGLKTTLTAIETEIDKELKPQSAVIPGWTIDGVVTVDRQKAEVKNVIGVLEGAGPLSDETIVIGAHYDHVGRGGAGSLAPGSTEIHNGADDNASGTVSLIELARRLGARKEKLPRRLVFIAFTGEETGLIGSAQYVKEPIFPLDKTIAMLNMDMVGRLSENKLTVFGSGTATHWASELEKLAKAGGFTPILKPEGFGPSDHSSFYGKKIPVLHFFTGNHNDYHRPTDDWEKINVEGMRRVVDLIEKVALDVAQNPERPQYVAIQTVANPLREGSRPYFGSIPDFGTDLPGYALAGVAPGSPAEKGGLQAGDRIIRFGKTKIDNLDDFDLALRKFSAGETVDVVVIRAAQEVSLKVVLDKPR
jgi:hypothetical protein